MKMTIHFININEDGVSYSCWYGSNQDKGEKIS